MKMEYRLLDNGKGIMLTRQPEFISGDLYISFTGAPEGATAIIVNGQKDSLYRRQKQPYARHFKAAT